MALCGLNMLCLNVDEPEPCIFIVELVEGDEILWRVLGLPTLQFRRPAPHSMSLYSIECSSEGRCKKSAMISISNGNGTKAIMTSPPGLFETFHFKTYFFIIYAFPYRLPASFGKNRTNGTQVKV